MSTAPLIIVSGPSGSGKSTLIRRVLTDLAGRLRLSVSATTRHPRPHESDGHDYHFWTRERFEAEVAAGGFLEWAVVHGELYGTLAAEVRPWRERGVGVILDIDVQGAEKVRQICPDHVSVFVRTESFETYEKRLRLRHTEDEAAIQRRLARAREELSRAAEYLFEIVNEDLETAVAQFRDLILRHHEQTDQCWMN